MTLYFCPHCNIVYDLNGNAPVCPKCGELLGLKQKEMDNAPTIAEVSGWVTHGPARRFEPRWRIG